MMTFHSEARMRTSIKNSILVTLLIFTSSTAFSASRLIAECTGPQTALLIFKDGELAFSLEVATSGYPQFREAAFVVPEGIEVTIGDGTTFTFKQRGWSNRITAGFLQILRRHDLHPLSIPLTCIPRNSL